MQSVLGLPSECIHHNKIRPCKLSFSCWLQGGKHAQGCGDNKWLFSCCVSEKDSMVTAVGASASASPIAYTGSASNLVKTIRKPYGLLKEKHARQSTTKINKLKFPKKNILRRRTDDSNLQVYIQ